MGIASPPSTQTTGLAYMNSTIYQQTISYAYQYEGLTTPASGLPSASEFFNATFWHKVTVPSSQISPLVATLTPTVGAIIGSIIGVGPLAITDAVDDSNIIG